GLSSLALLVDDANEVGNLLDHTAHGRRVLEDAAAVQLVETKTDQGPGLDLGPADRAAVLLDRDRLLGCHGSVPSQSVRRAGPYASAATSAAEPSRRRATISDTFLLRRAATERGFSCSFSASNVARTTL